MNSYIQTSSTGQSDWSGWFSDGGSGVGGSHVLARVEAHVLALREHVDLAEGGSG